jgi:hypothetical protein
VHHAGGEAELVSQIEPLRQILSGTRSILYFNSAGNAGVTRGIITATAGLISGSFSARPSSGGMTGKDCGG